jgi:hypothetical protein
MGRFDVNIQLHNCQRKGLLRQQPFHYRKGGGGLLPLLHSRGKEAHIVLLGRK